MKLVGIIGTALLSLILAAPVYAQEQRDQDEQKDQKEETAKPGTTPGVAKFPRAIEFSFHLREKRVVMENPGVFGDRKRPSTSLGT